MAYLVPSLQFKSDLPMTSTRTQEAIKHFCERINSSMLVSGGMEEEPEEEEEMPSYSDMLTATGDLGGQRRLKTGLLLQREVQSCCSSAR